MGTRLAIFLSSMRMGGAERVALTLAAGIAEYGYDVELVLVAAEGPLLSEVPPTVGIVDLGRKRVATSLPALVRYLRKHRPAVLLSVLDYVNIVAIWARYLAGGRTRLCVSEHSMLSHRARFSSSRRVSLLPALARRFYPCADAVIAVSRGVADDLADKIRIPRHLIRVIYNPISTGVIYQKSKEPCTHSWFQAAQPVVLSVGRLSGEKDFPTLIQAFAQVRRSRSARLLILGEGEERSRLEALVKQLGLAEDVALPGFETNPYPFMARAALFVLPSRLEGLPVVLIEALRCGTRVLSTDCPSGPREILGQGKFGRLVPVGDVEGMARAIEDALDEEPKRPPPESWLPFKQETVVDQYLEVLLGPQDGGCQE